MYAPLVRRLQKASLFALGFVPALLCPAVAHAAEPQQDTADGSDHCRAFLDKNELERKAWEAKQPAQPFQLKPPETVLDAPWSAFFTWFGGNLDLIAATFIPHLGAQLRGPTPATTLSWPWSFPLGPYYACSRKTGTYGFVGHKSHRLMLEPAIVLGDLGIGFTARPGYRFLYHPTDWVVGVGGGLGSTIEIAGNHEPLRPSVGPEVVLQFGHCCERSYFNLAIRYDYYSAGREQHILGASLGYVYF
jgi:hypothetical protein